mmetsp:Transcript_15242/g.19890  ORF Transcript_15242/g.19890 Transcript_15242/m.19890 type:complete len:261 (-) Transcript_15242:267-1049(-)|eukprot:CAMPEP_0198146488 /NCGR_PEP_ID=MMETSP1443-20131203/29606_1 /TAXON_ID=186043 /ORGANISM="Entomoneis sp., Strain CCMP2396" /LENGTH=260 /DNA_ID=CAMNT_0043810473 /DNA_START=32 /DNA_END=814 /DNA_ORIENTATION=-
MASTKGNPGSPDMLTQVANEILNSAELISNRLEEGLNVLLSGGSDSSASASASGGEAKQMPPSPEFQEEMKEMMQDEDFDWNEMDMDSESPLSGLAESVMGGIMEGQSGPQTFQEHFEAFRSAITWSEPFIMGLVAFQLIIFLSTLYVCRKNVALAPRIVLMVMIAGTVRSAEMLNSWASKNWEDWGITQNYFDPRGIFVSIFVCAPLMVNSFIMLIMFLRESSVLLVQVKTAELKQKRKKNKQQQEAGGNPKRRGKKDQ